nr:hypothetical protein [Streptomyces aureocirculatus]
MLLMLHVLLCLLLLVLSLLLVLVVVRLLGVRLVRVLRVLRVLRVVLPLAAVGGLAVGLLSSPSAVPVQRVLGMPRFGAWAPAILSHRSPTSREAGAASLDVRATVPPLDAVRRLFESRRIARNVTVSRSDDHFDALAGDPA